MITLLARALPISFAALALAALAPAACNVSIVVQDGGTDASAIEDAATFGDASADGATDASADGATDGGTAAPFARAFPASTPIPLDGTSRLTVIDVSTQENLQSAVGALQGLANRPPNVPTVFALYNRKNNSDSFWLNQLHDAYDIQSPAAPITIEDAFAKSELTKLASDAAGLKVVVYCEGTTSCGGSVAPTSCTDSGYAIAEHNVALSLSGVLDAIPVSCSEWGALQALMPARTKFHVTDLTAKPWVSAGNADSKLGAYTWAWGYPGSHPGTPAFGTQVLFLDPSTKTAPVQAREELDDYVVENRGFVFEFNDTGEPTAAQLAWATNTVFPVYAQNNPDALGMTMGWFGLGDELPTVTTLSKSGMNMQNGWLPNLSVYTGLPVERAHQVSSGRTLTYDPSATYVLFEYTQGGDVEYLASDMIGYWGASPADATLTKERTSYSKSWMFDAFATELLPPAVRYFFGTMDSHDSFITGASGAGYVHPSEFSTESLRRYTSVMKPRFDGLDMSIAWINDGSHPEFTTCAASTAYNSVLSTYAANLNEDAYATNATPPLRGLLAIAPNILCPPQLIPSTVGAVQATTPLMPDYKKWRVQEPTTTGVALASDLNQDICGAATCPSGVQGSGSHFVFVFFDFVARPGMIGETQQAWMAATGPAYNPKTVLVRADEFMDLIMQEGNSCPYTGAVRSCVNQGSPGHQECIARGGTTVWQPCR